jgi:hypothetical protein
MDTKRDGALADLRRANAGPHRVQEGANDRSLVDPIIRWCGDEGLQIWPRSYPWQDQTRNRDCYATRIASASIGVRLKKYSPRCSKPTNSAIHASASSVLSAPQLRAYPAINLAIQ